MIVIRSKGSIRSIGETCGECRPGVVIVTVNRAGDSF